MALDLQRISPELKSILMNLKNLSPMQRFEVVSLRRMELRGMTVAFEYGMEKLEKQGWVIPDEEFTAPTESAQEKKALSTQPSAFSHGNSAGPVEQPDAGVVRNSLQVRNAGSADQNQAGDLNAKANGNGNGENPGNNNDQQSCEASRPAITLQEIAAQVNAARQRGAGQLTVRSEFLPAVTNNENGGNPVTVDVHAIAAVNPLPALPAAGPELTRAELDRLYSGEDRAYGRTEPDPAAERARAIEQARKIQRGKTQMNGHWEVLSDEDLENEEVRNAVEAQGGADAAPVNPEYVLARDGYMIRRTQLQWALEDEIRKKMGVPEDWRGDDYKIEWHKEQLRRLEKADAAPRCEHIYADGTTCRSPRMKTGRWCYAHERMKEVRPTKLKLLPMEDANSIMLNLMEIGRALCDDEISEKKAGLLMYREQLGLVALGRMTFKDTDVKRMVRELPAEPDQTSHGRTGARNKAIAGAGRVDGRGTQAQKQRSKTIEAAPLEKTRNSARASSRQLQHRQADNAERPAARKAMSTNAKAVAGQKNSSRINPGDVSAKSNRFGDDPQGVGGQRVFSRRGDGRGPKSQPLLPEKGVRVRGTGA